MIDDLNHLLELDQFFKFSIQIYFHRLSKNAKQNKHTYRIEPVDFLVTVIPKG